MPTIWDWPDDLRPASVEWGLITPQQAGRSSFDGSLQVQTLGAPRWAFTMSTGVIKASEVPKWECFLDLMFGQVNRARVWDWRREQPLGVATGTPTVRVAATGGVVDIQGWTPSVTGILLRGSYMGINGELKRLTGDINSDSLGRATASFTPPLRGTAPAGGAITLVKPKAKFMLMTERFAFTQNGARHPGITLAWEEDLGP